MNEGHFPMGHFCPSLHFVHVVSLHQKFKTNRIMAIKYSVEQMKVGFGKDKSTAYVGRARLGDTISTEKLEEQVGLRTMLPQTVVHTVFANLVASVIHFIEEGHGVRLGELGILRPSITTKSGEKDEDVSVTNLRVKYWQSKEMRQAVSNLHVRKLADDNEEEEEEDYNDNSSSSSGNTGTGEDSNPL